MAIACGVLACLAAASRTSAQEGPSPNLQLRLYVNAFTAGKVEKTPADPAASFDGHVPGNDGAALEVILFRHLGLAVAQDIESRNSTDKAGNELKERWTDTYYSLTAYLRATGSGHWNLFAGAGSGSVDQYAATLNGVGSPPTNSLHSLPLSRTFGGIDLAFRRIGFRAQVVELEAAKTVSGQKLALNQTLQVLSVFIPFN